MSRILPALCPLVIYAPLDLTQYTTVMQVITELLGRADSDLRKEYERYLQAFLLFSFVELCKHIALAY